MLKNKANLLFSFILLTQQLLQVFLFSRGLIHVDSKKWNDLPTCIPSFLLEICLPHPVLPYKEVSLCQVAV